MVQQQLLSCYNWTNILDTKFKIQNLAEPTNSKSLLSTFHNNFLKFQRQCGYDKLEGSTKEFIERDTIEGSSTIEGSGIVDLYRSDMFLHDETEEERFSWIFFKF